MNRIGIIRSILNVALIILVQVIVFKGLVLFGSAFCFIYLLLFLLLPKDVNPMLQVLLGFSVGLIVDTFYNTPGIHASVSTLMMLVRPYWMNVLTPSGGYDIGAKMNVNAQGIQWFMSYSVPLILLHHMLLFLIESAGFNNFGATFMKGLYSTFFTFTVVAIIQYLFFKKGRY